MHVYTYICIYIYNMHLIIKISIHNNFPKNLQKSFLTAKGAGGREGSSRAGTWRKLLLFPACRAAQQFTLQGRGASLCSLNPNPSCCQLQAQHLPQSVSLLHPGCDSKTAAAKIIILQTVHKRHQQNGFGIGFLWCTLWVTQKPHVSDVCY